MGSARLAREYFAHSSDNSLKCLELAQCNSIAELRRQLLRVVGEWIEAEVEFRVAHGILGNRQNDDLSGTHKWSMAQPRQPLGPHTACPGGARSVAGDSASAIGGPTGRSRKPFPRSIVVAVLRGSTAGTWLRPAQPHALQRRPRARREDDHGGLRSL